jgi:alpha-glucosidase
MLSDSPTHYYEQAECMEFLAAVPTVWDETKVLAASIGEYIVTARRSGPTWYIGAMTNWTPRDLDLDLNFLGNGNYTLTSWSDGVNAARYAADYRKSMNPVKGAQHISVHLAPGGGYTAIIKPLTN